MDTLIISKVGNFCTRVASFWDCKSHSTKYKVVGTEKTFKTQKGAIRNAQRALKKKRDVYLKDHPELRRTKKIKRRRTKPVIKKNVWSQLNLK